MRGWTAPGNRSGFQRYGGHRATEVPHFAFIVSRILEATGSNYVPIFVICGFAYLATLGLVHLLAPKLESPVLDR